MIKSKNARQTLTAAERYINDEEVEKRLDIDSAIVERVFAERAVELAEEDARERAAQTFCALQRLDCEIHCTPCIGAECVGRNEFLKHYDNEQ